MFRRVGTLPYLILSICSFGFKRREFFVAVVSHGFDYLLGRELVKIPRDIGKGVRFEYRIYQVDMGRQDDIAM